MNLEIPPLKTYRNKHKNQIGVVFGTGDSLNRTDFTDITKTVTFGVNHLYKGFDRFGFKTDYYVFCDCRAVKWYYQDIIALKIPIFVAGGAVWTWHNIKHSGRFKPYNPPVPIYELKNSTKLLYDMEIGCRGGNVVISAIQIAIWMGCNPICLTGCDFTYGGYPYKKPYFDNTKPEVLTGHKTLKLYKQGRELNIPWLTEQYKRIRRYCEHRKIKIYNCTVGGELEIFERKTLQEVIKSNGYK